MKEFWYTIQFIFTVLGGWLGYFYDYNAVQKRVNELMAKPVLKSVDEIAKEVIQGKWGNGDERKTKLTSAGYDYGKVQARVNELMKNQ